MWLEFDSLVNARDVGGIPTPEGPVQSRRLIRSDNLQELTPADIARLADLGLTDVVDLRSTYEVHHEGPGPLVGRDGVTIHHHSYLPEVHDDVSAQESGSDVINEALATSSTAESTTEGTEQPAVTQPAGDHSVAAEAVGTRLPWVRKRPVVDVDSKDRFSAHYLGYLVDRPESVLGALRAIAHAPGAALVHCAAGKDRTGTTVALSLSLIGADREAIIADYAASSERMEKIVARLKARETYRPNLEGVPLSKHLTHPEAMRAVLDHIDKHYDGVPALLARMGWTGADTTAMQRKLLG